MITYITIQGQKDQAIEEFARDQRQEQYATILQQATRLDNAGTFTTSALASAQLSLGMAQLGGTGMSTIPPAESASTEAARAFGQAAQTATGLAPASERLAGLHTQNSWQDAYTALDQAISNAEIAGSKNSINYASALRDKYRNDYRQSIFDNLDPLIALYPDPKPDKNELADSLVGVPAETSPRSYESTLLDKSTDELTTMYVEAAKVDLGLNDR